MVSVSHDTQDTLIIILLLTQLETKYLSRLEPQPPHYNYTNTEIAEFIIYYFIHFIR